MTTRSSSGLDSCAIGRTSGAHPCSTAQEGFEAVETLKPDVLVLDLKLAGDDGLSLLRRLDSTKPPAVVVLTASQDEDDLLAAARLGARGIVLKAMAPRVLEDCLRTVSAGGQSLNVDGVDLANRLTQRQSVEDELEQVLTPRELEILRLVAMRLDNQEIATAADQHRGEDPPASRHEKLLRGRHVCSSISATASTESRSKDQEGFPKGRSPGLLIFPISCCLADGAVAGRRYDVRGGDRPCC